ncbi:MAG: glycosyltransferase family 2 protein [Bacteroidaceae bacterium]
MNNINRTDNNIIDISFITINYNGLEDTCDLIESLTNNTKLISYEIIVIDNASKKDEAQVIAKKYSNVIVVASEINRGFSAGNNLGIKISRGKYICIINNDTYIKTDHWNLLIKRFESSEKIGAISPKLCFAEDERTIQFAGSTPLSPITLRNSTIGYGKINDGRFDEAAPTSFLHGAAMLVKREVIEKVGLMPDIYFLYYEEIDWCTKILNAGYELWYEPACTVYHKESKSTGLNSPLKSFYLTRNRALYAYRNKTGFNRVLSVAYLLTIPIIKSIIVNCIKRPQNALASIKAVWAFIILKNKRI